MMVSYGKHTLARGRRFSVLQEALVLEGATSFQLMINSSLLKYCLISRYTTGLFSSSSRIRVRKSLFSWDYASKITLILIQAGFYRLDVAVFHAQHVDINDITFVQRVSNFIISGQDVATRTVSSVSRVRAIRESKAPDWLSHYLCDIPPVSDKLGNLFVHEDSTDGLLNVLVQVLMGDMRGPGGTG
ncbi:hypothetical protein ARMGADRAFT_1036850 [Armillaria gallica]|uniref:Uncharacterized protein n=1 Tax=Armillaria gallica TaxID=47427 RepID=A0A2H3D2C4_ARMGA|nr:hypothetical protein ARMGADRAFT_1036850 [Armillaria gallica]